MTAREQAEAILKEVGKPIRVLKNGQSEQLMFGDATNDVVIDAITKALEASKQEGREEREYELGTQVPIIMNSQVGYNAGLKKAAEIGWKMMNDLSTPTMPDELLKAIEAEIK